jgi:hypothetical protein
MDRSGPGDSPGGLGSLDEVLAHYGVRGMKWGVRRRSPGASTVEVATPAGRGVQTRGGSGQRASEDAVRAAIAKQKARKSTVSSLSNRELQDLVTRLQLEQNFDRLRPRRPSEQVVKFISDTLVGVGKDEASKYARQAVTNQIAGALKK